MNWSDIFASSGVTTLSLALLAFLAKDWISTRLREGVAAEYNRALATFKEELRWDVRRREQATQVAEVFSVFFAQSYDSSRDTNAIRLELQKKYWELSLWLDAPVLRQVNELFVQGGPAGLRHKEILVAVRKLIVGADDDVTADELVHWDPVKNPTQVSAETS
jgi:hypothetical protein